MEDKELQYLHDRIAMFVKCLIQKGKTKREILKFLEVQFGDVPLDN